MPANAPGRVLVVEDDKILAEILRTFIANAGHEVAVFHDGPQAMVSATSWRPTAAIIDIGLPSISGYAVGQHLREQLGRSVLIIALTAHDRPDEIEMARYAGFNWHFAKPADTALIMEVLANPRRKPAAQRDGIPLAP